MKCPTGWKVPGVSCTSTPKVAFFRASLAQPPPITIPVEFTTVKVRVKVVALPSPSLAETARVCSPGSSPAISSPEVTGAPSSVAVSSATPLHASSAPNSMRCVP